MIERYLPLADSLARRYRHTSEPLDDLMQVARLGLVKAVDRWDAHRGTAFSSFAVPTITGELRRHFRDRTWTVRTPRDVQDLYLSARITRDRLSLERGREPTAADVATTLGRPVEDIVEALQAGDAHTPCSLDAPIRGDGDDGFTRADRVPDGRRDLAAAEDAAALWQLASVLDSRSREVVRLRFQEDLLQREIAERIGVSQIYVSRLLSDAVARLRAAADAAGVAF
jgi:RNA polymerase sigma-B factor